MATSSHIEYRVDEQPVGEREALQASVHTRHFLSGGATEKIEMYHQARLYKVIYPLRQPPFDELLQAHSTSYGGTDCEIEGTRRNSSDPVREFDTWLFEGGRRLSLHKVCLEDRDGRLLQETEYDPAGNFITAYGYRYDGEKLVRVVEMDREGNTIAEQDLI